MTADHSALWQGLLTHCPELQPFYDEHMNTWGEELIYLLMSDLATYVHALHRVHVLTSGEIADQAKALLLRIIDFLEDCVESSDDQIQGTVYLSFLPGFDVDEEFFESFKQLMGPKLLKALEELNEPEH